MAEGCLLRLVLCCTRPRLKHYPRFGHIECLERLSLVDTCLFAQVSEVCQLVDSSSLEPYRTECPGCMILQQLLLSQPQEYTHPKQDLPFPQQPHISLDQCLVPFQRQSLPPQRHVLCLLSLPMFGQYLANLSIFVSCPMK